MKYKLINPINPKYNAIEQVLTNRGIKYEDIKPFLYTTDEDISSPLLLGTHTVMSGARVLLTRAILGHKTLVVVDADCDGYTSAALLINYLNDIAPSFVESRLEWFLHDSKQHGLSDCVDYILEHEYKLVILPDASSNDYEYHKILAENDIQVLVLDHHEAEYISPDAIVINNQLSNYPNKDLSGVGVTWQFCRAIDELNNLDFANKYLDLVALGLTADMMSMLSPETKHLVQKGFTQENLRNPFIYEMAKKNSFSLGDSITPMGAAFYIAPFVNSMVRSGTQEEKELLFKSMLTFKAFEQIPSTKRGHALGEMERVVDQAVRVATNVKNRQTRTQDESLDFLEAMIQRQNLLEHKVLLFLLEPGQIDRNVAGLIANKFIAKYQRPCCILTKVVDTEETGEKRLSYQGSARGYDKSGFTNFKSICAGFEGTLYAEGHPGAFGLGLRAEDIEGFISYTDEALAEMSGEPIYLVDYIFTEHGVKKEYILDIADMDHLWGKNLEEALIAIQGIKVTSDMVTLMSPDRKPTLKITLPNGVCLIKFNSNEAEYEKFLSTGYVEVNIVGTCNKNEWCGYITPQVFIQDYDIVGQARYMF